MLTKIIFLLTLLAYAVIVSQSFMYLLALKNVQLGLGGSSYTELRKLIDSNMRKTLTVVVYAALLANLLLIIFTSKTPASPIFIAALISMIALIIDTVLTLKGNLPINNIINTWTPDSYPANWAEFRTKWFQIYHYRQITTIIGFMSLVMTGAMNLRIGGLTN